MQDKPVIFKWDGERLTPATPAQLKLANEFWDPGALVPLLEWQNRDENSHKHYFATLKDLWLNLPDELRGEFPTPEHLRKHGLIHCGWATKTEIVCDTPGDAAILAGYLGALDTYSIIRVNGTRVTRWVAASQNHVAMGRQSFQRSKWDVLNWASDMLKLAADDPHRSADG